MDIPSDRPFDEEVLPVNYRALVYLYASLMEQLLDAHRTLLGYQAHVADLTRELEQLRGSDNSSSSHFPPPSSGSRN